MPLDFPSYLPDLDELGSEQNDPYLAELEALQAEEFQPGQFRGGGSEIFSGLEEMRLPRARSFGEGLLYGLTGGLGRAGSAAAAKRQQFEESEARRRAQFDLERREATRALRSMSGQERRETIKAEREARKEQDKLDREEPIVDAGLIARHPDVPWLSRFQGQRVPRSWLQPPKPEDRAKAAREERLAASADRAAQASARQERLANVNTISKLADDYRVDPDITAYRTGQQNLSTMRQAAKLKSGPGDLAMLIAYVRATEPGVLSVVRQEELANVQTAVGALRRYMNLPSQWISGQRLTDSGRAEMLKAGNEISKAQKDAFDRANEQYRQRSAAFGVDPSLFMREYGQPGAAESRVRPSNVVPQQIDDATLEAEYARRRRR